MNIIPSESEINTLAKIGTMAIKSGFLPSSIKTPEQAIIIALKGKELGIPPLQAFAQIAVVNGKPTMSAELMQALILKNIPTAEISFVENSNEKCIIKTRRSSNQEYSVFSFTIDDAKNAGLLTKQVWKQYPSAMLKARCISSMARALYADAIMGVSYVPEELDANVNKDGEIVEEINTAKTEPAKKEKPKKVEAVVVNDEVEKALNYKLTFTKDSGKTLGDVLKEKGIEHIKLQADKIMKHYESKNLPLDDNAKEYLNHATTLVIENENVR